MVYDGIRIYVIDRHSIRLSLCHIPSCGSVEPQLRKVNRLTRDHRPDDLAEAERIQSEGGEVRRLRPGSGTSRIFAPGWARSGKRSLALSL